MWEFEVNIYIYIWFPWQPLLSQTPLSIGRRLEYCLWDKNKRVRKIGPFGHTFHLCY